jgi:DNA polymerase I-like protein with 3'-5' exonuclease and polymerase domains
MIAIDSETTGVDLFHGAKPFFVTVCEPGKVPECWQWEVCPFTRQPKVPSGDVDEILETLGKHDCYVFHNSKFDIRALRTIGINLEPDWGLVHDTLIAGHVLASNHRHDLTAMAVEYLGLNIRPAELALEEAVVKARRHCRARLKGWRLAKAGDPAMPSIKKSKSNKDKGEKAWKFDSWVPRALKLRAQDEHPKEWDSVLSDYANLDSWTTIRLWEVCEVELKRKGLWEIYLSRLQAQRLAYILEENGTTVITSNLRDLKLRYEEESKRAGAKCVQIAKGRGFDLNLPKGPRNQSLVEFMFRSPIGLKLEVLKWTDSNDPSPSMDAKVLEEYVKTEEGEALEFCRELAGKRTRDTAVAYMAGYESHRIETRRPGYWTLHGSVNPTGTDTLRWSFSNPNSSNISKKEDFNLRYAFGPMPDREWYSMDGQNLELRIPTFEAGEEELMEVFCHPDRPPYFGSYHLLIFHLLHPQEFKKHGKACKTVFKSTLYQWVKNGNFAIIYGAQQLKADATYHVPGAYSLIQDRFPKIAQLSAYQISFAQDHGYVETIPDKTINPKRGYPLLATRDERGRIMPTVPLNYHVQGTAMWWTHKAMIRCQAQIEEWNAVLPPDQHIKMIFQIHDELVFDFPRGRGREPWRTNLPKVRKLKSLMEEGGADIGVLTPVGAECHPRNWSEGVVLFS